MISKWAYILIGDDKTGKTTFQKHLILRLCGVNKFDRLYTNIVHQINHSDSPRKFKTLFVINRSIQEKMDTYENIEEYFKKFFHDADICILSSHSHQPCIDDISRMIEQLNQRYYNVCAVFFSNCLNADTEDIAKLNWREKIVIDNPLNDENWEQQIENGAILFAETIIRIASKHC